MYEPDTVSCLVVVIICCEEIPIVYLVPVSVLCCPVLGCCYVPVTNWPDLY